MMVNRNKKLIPILLLTLLLFSCTGKEEIDELAMVMAVGIDKTENGTIELTAQVARPSDARGNAGAGGGTGEAIWTATAEGKTIFEAIRNLGRFSSKRVYWGHNMIIVVNEAVARDGIVDIIDFFTRNNELRMRTWIVVSKQKASEVVVTKTGLEVIPGESLDRLFRYSPNVAEAPRSDVMTLTEGFVGEHVHPYLAVVTIVKRGKVGKGEFGSEPQVELSGTAIFRDDKMVGKLNTRESRGFLWFVETLGTPIIPLTCPKEEGQVSVELRENKFELTPQYKKGKPSFKVEVYSDAHLVELGCPTKLEHSEIMKQLEEEVEGYIKKDIEMMLEKTQKELKVDAPRLGRAFQRIYPQHWNMIKEDWDEIFPNVEVEIEVTVDINNPQLLENPTRRSKD